MPIETGSTTTAPGVAFRSNREIALHVPDLTTAKEFYCSVLGFRLVAENATMLELDSGELRLYVIHNPAGVMTYIPSFDVASREAAHAYLVAAGCATLPAGSHSTAVYYRDPFGLVFDIVER